MQQCKQILKSKSYLQRLSHRDPHACGDSDAEAPGFPVLETAFNFMTLIQTKAKYIV